MKKKLFSMLLAGVLAAGCLAGCGNTADSGDAPAASAEAEGDGAAAEGMDLSELKIGELESYVINDGGWCQATHTGIVNAMEELGITPIMTPIRGCTDGAKLSWMGLPCPNLCTGAYHYHTVYEFCCVESMEKTVDLLVRIVEKYAAS